VLTELALLWVALRGFDQAVEWASALRQTDWAPKVEQLAVLYQFNSMMKTGAGITSTLAFAASLMSGSSTQSGSSDGSASKKPKTTGTTPPHYHRLHHGHQSRRE
jgi:hypothetical protein